MGSYLPRWSRETFHRTPSARFTDAKTTRASDQDQIALECTKSALALGSQWHPGEHHGTRHVTRSSDAFRVQVSFRNNNAAVLDSRRGESINLIDNQPTWCLY